MRISDWSSDVCSSDLTCRAFFLSFPQPSETVAEAGFGGSPCPVGREPLFPRQDIHVLTRARAIHGALVSAPGRQDPAHLYARIGASIKAPHVGVAPRVFLRFVFLGRSRANEWPSRRPGRGEGS